LRGDSQLNVGFVAKKYLHAMYTAYNACPEKEILLWCDSRGRNDFDDSDQRMKQHKTTDTSSMTSKRE
jgi:hypothetical protein